MLGWLYRLLIGNFKISSVCSHKWRIYRETELLSVERDAIINHIYMLQCAKCGDLKSHIAV